MLKEEVMNLWRICFKDTEEFIRFYFDRKYSDRNTLVSVKEGRVVSTLQMLPYPMTWHGAPVSTSYISGACTLPAARSKGLMRKLLAEAFIILKNRKIAFSTLIPQEPWLYEYYSRSGYAPVLACKPENYYLPVRNDNAAIICPEREELHKMPGLYEWFNEQMRQRSDCIQHTKEDFETIIDDLYLSGGCLLLRKNENGYLRGMAFAVPHSDKVCINELLAESEEIKEALLQAAAYKWGKNEIECKTPAGMSPKQKVIGMARIIDARQVLAIYASTHPKKTFFLHLNDPELPSNNGYYRIMNGKVFRTGSGVNKPDYTLNIRELTQILFETPAFISLMLD